LLDGTLPFVIPHPASIPQEALAGMDRAVSAPNERGDVTTILPFEVYTRAVGVNATAPSSLWRELSHRRGSPIADACRTKDAG
jgi:hypothetical protein